MIVASWFMLRESELAGARVRDMSLSAAVFGGGVSLDLPLHKTAQGGQKELTRRSLRCVCTAAIHPLCPSCAARRHLARLNFDTAREPESALFPTTTTVLRTKAASVEMFGLVLGTAGVETQHTTPDGRTVPIFGGHSARVAGATFLAARGVAAAVIQLLGRWSSSAVERYTQSAPLTYAAAAVPAQALATTPVDQPAAKAQPAAPQYPAIADVDRENSWEVVAPPDAQSEEDGLAGVAFVPAPLRAEAVAEVVGDAPTVYLLDSRTKVVHLPGPDESGLERHEWAARCGWPYGLRQFFRLSAEPPEPRRCQRCFPVVALDAAEVVGSSDDGSSSSSSGRSSTSASD